MRNTYGGVLPEKLLQIIEIAQDCYIPIKMNSSRLIQTNYETMVGRCGRSLLGATNNKIEWLNVCYRTLGSKVLV